MHGYPNTIATRQDVAVLLAIPEYHDRVVAHVQLLMDERYGWVLIGQLAGDESGETSAGHKVVEIRDPVGGAVTERYQYTWDILPQNGLARLGVTPEEAAAWGCEDRAIEAPAE